MLYQNRTLINNHYCQKHWVSSKIICGILIVDFANRLQQKEKLDILTAITRSASLRLRPILMTTAAMVLGVVPLMLASGAGAKSRLSIGVVIAAGMLIGTCFTLFVVPTMYILLGQWRKK